MAGAAPAAANRVGSQPMLMATWSLVRPGAMRAGHAITMGMRSPPSSKSLILPVNGQASEKRSPPLSLVNMTVVFSVRPLASKASSTRPICVSIDLIMR